MSNRTLPKPGHVGGDLRGDFQTAVTEDDASALYRLAGKLWSCTDTMPSDLCYDLDMPSGSSYAQAARVIRQGARP